jgi:hypothetical protein
MLRHWWFVGRLLGLFLKQQKGTCNLGIWETALNVHPC